MSDRDPQDQRISSIAQRAVLPIAAIATVAEARESLPGQILVLVDEAGRPMGILLEEQLAGLDPERELRSYPDFILPVTVTTEEASVEEVLPGVWLDPYVRWHLVMKEGEMVGAVSPRALLEAWWQRAQNDPAFAEATRGTLSYLTQLPTDLWGKPPPGVGQTFNVCYRCDPGPPAPRHWVDPKDVNQRDQSGRAICPKHNIPMTAENPCQGQTD